MEKLVATNSLDRGLEILKLIGGRRGGLTNGEISRELQIPKSTCSYILRKLMKEGYVTKQESTGRFRIGLKTLTLAHDALREAGFYAAAEPALYRLAEETGLAAIVAALEGDRVLTIDRVESPEFAKDNADAGRSNWLYYPPRDKRSIGAEWPAHATSFGRVLLAYLPKPELLKLLDRIPLTKITPHTVASKPELLAELERVRQQGYSIVDRQSHMDTVAIAAPIFGASGEVRAAVAIGGSRVLPVWDDMGRLIRLVKEAAAEIARQSNRLAVFTTPEMQQPMPMRGSNTKALTM